MSIIISVIVMLLWVAMMSTTNMWIGSKIGDVFIMIISLSSVYGCIVATESLIKWAMK